MKSAFTPNTFVKKQLFSGQYNKSIDEGDDREKSLDNERNSKKPLTDNNGIKKSSKEYD